MIRLFFLSALIACFASFATAQTANISLGTSGFDSTAPVEVTADELSVDQANGQAVFNGNVLVVQGDVRMSAGQVTIEYAAEGAENGISRLIASNGVTFVTPADSAEAREAVYSVANATVTLNGDVLLTQGQNAIGGDRLTVDLTSGVGQIEGRVRTIFNAGGGN